MQLNSSDGASVELRVAGYQFPEYHTPAPDGDLRVPKVQGSIPVVADRKWDPNWLQVYGRVTLADSKTWAFKDPCLTTWEARELGHWLCAVATGTEQPSRGYRESQGWAVFTEPNLGFTLEQRTADRVRIRADFGLEARPKWLQETRRNRPGFALVPLDVSAGEVAHAAARAGEPGNPSDGETRASRS